MKTKQKIAEHLVAEINSTLLTLMPHEERRIESIVDECSIELIASNVSDLIGESEETIQNILNEIL